MRLRRSVSPKTVIPREGEIHEIDYKNLRWVHIISPTQAEKEWLENEFHFHRLDIEDVMSRNQRPKVDDYPDYLFAVLHFPLWDYEEKRLLSGEVDLFVGKDYVVMITTPELASLSDLFCSAEKDSHRREELMGRGSGYLLYKITKLLFERCLPMLEYVGAKLDKIEEDIFKGGSDGLVREMAAVRQEIITFRRTMRPQRAIIPNLEKSKGRFSSDSPEIEYYFDDVQDAAERIWDLLENYQEVVQSLVETNESLVAYSLNKALRILTAISAVLLPLTLVASVFGMNVHLPGQDSPEAFWGIMTIMFVSLTGMVIIFRRRGWL